MQHAHTPPDTETTTFIVLVFRPEAASQPAGLKMDPFDGIEVLAYGVTSEDSVNQLIDDAQANHPDWIFQYEPVKSPPPATHGVIEVSADGHELRLDLIGPYTNSEAADADADELMELCDYGGSGSTFHSIGLGYFTSPDKAKEDAKS